VNVRQKDERLEARVSVEENEIITEAARLRGISKSAFVVQSALAEANQALRDQQVTVVGRQHAEAFAAWLDQPATVITEMLPLAEAPVLPHR
jgi:uncharacterized protein (DUF1778 family)